MFNYLIMTITCPRCGIDTEIEAEFRFGFRELAFYRIGDQLRWDGSGSKTPQTRPESGFYDGEAYAVCSHCNLDFWLNVSVRNDVIVSATVNSAKQPYILDTANSSKHHTSES